MNCIECGNKCVKVDVDSTPTTVSYQCPSCCNTFTKTVRPKYLVWTKDETGWTETADKPMTEREASKRASWYRNECRVEAKALPQGKKPEAA